MDNPWSADVFAHKNLDSHVPEWHEGYHIFFLLDVVDVKSQSHNEETIYQNNR